MKAESYKGDFFFVLANFRARIYRKNICAFKSNERVPCGSIGGDAIENCYTINRFQSKIPCFRE